VFRIHEILGWIRILIRGSIPLTSESGSGRPKNMLIRWIRIRVRIRAVARREKQTNIDSIIGGQLSVDQQERRSRQPRPSLLFPRTTWRIRIPDPKPWTVQNTINLFYSWIFLLTGSVRKSTPAGGWRWRRVVLNQCQRSRVSNARNVANRFATNTS
jgi:hypothetical protein